MIFPFPTPCGENWCSCNMTGCPDFCSFGRLPKRITTATVLYGRETIPIRVSKPAYRVNLSDMSIQRRKIIKRAQQRGNAKQYGANPSLRQTTKKW